MPALGKVQYLREFLFEASLKRFDDSGVNVEGADLFSTNSLRVTFELVQTLYGFPMQAKFRIYNLRRDMVRAFQNDALHIRFSAGYGGTLRELFRGKVYNVHALRENEDSIMELYATDGELWHSGGSEFSATFSKGALLRDIVFRVRQAMKGVSGGSLAVLGTKKITSPLSLHGKCHTIMNDLAKAHNFWWSVQFGDLVLIDKNGAVAKEEVIKINRNSGMIGSPALTLVGVDVTCLLNPDIRPFRLIQVDSLTPNVNIPNLYTLKTPQTLGEGLYRVDQVTHRGDSRGDQWESSSITRTFVNTPLPELTQ